MVHVQGQGRRDFWFFWLFWAIIGKKRNSITYLWRFSGSSFFAACFLDACEIYRLPFCISSHEWRTDNLRIMHKAWAICDRDRRSSFVQKIAVRSAIAKATIGIVKNAIFLTIVAFCSRYEVSFRLYCNKCRIKLILISGSNITLLNTKSTLYARKKSLNLKLEKK